MSSEKRRHACGCDGSDRESRVSARAVELGDIQGLLRFGYGALRHARFLMLRIDEPSRVIESDERNNAYRFR